MSEKEDQRNGIFLWMRFLTSSEKQMYLAISKNVMGFFTAKEMMLY